MKKGLTELVMILDRSGSMAGLELDTIGGFNSMLERQKQEEGETYVTLVLFDHETEVLYDRKELSAVEPLTRKQYYVRGCTALLDAIGETMDRIWTIHKYARSEDVPEKTLFIITTDGMENDSKHYTYEKVKEMIETRKEESQWEFLFFGANIDAVKVAGSFGIGPSRAVTYEHDSEGTVLNFHVMSEVVSAARGASSREAFSKHLDECRVLDEVREDYKKRHKGEGVVSKPL